MSSIRRFLELSIPTEDIQASLDFYTRLGLTELAVNDVRTHHYAVVTDGRIAIGLHAGGFEEPALSFVFPDLAKSVSHIEALGHEIAFAELGREKFNEASFYSPDGHTLRFMEARTFSPPPVGSRQQGAIGQFANIALRCQDYYAAFTFWELADFAADEDPVTPIEDLDTLTLRAPGMVVNLRSDLRTREPVVCFETGDLALASATLKRLDIPCRFRESTGVLTAPEGTRIEVRSQ